MSYETIKVETRGRVGLITFNRPKAMNALSQQMMREIVQALSAFGGDAKIGAVVLTGSEKAFAAGADIKEMQEVEFTEAFFSDLWGEWEGLGNFRKPTIAAVAGYALGGGCEVALMCDFVIAADNAKFGQPEITLGVIPGMGGTQRLARSIGKAKAMDLCLTGRMMDATEAERCGLVSRIVPASELIEEALRAADKIANFSLPAVMMTKEAVNRAFEVPLSEGLRFERRLFHSTFATEDQSEGMDAFIQKRTPQFRNR
ncbi:enoyl-CoA hydratase [Jiella marina]|uniref:enoyl-CoA hydratase n=1 Tax=Jiella sp. LLJ827 TaxID=2917712 RepID=UPI002100E623|nr:enoyl-CoA hydratase [Jiella sp. LLJ827]MCQ0989434.1 enoyl-CoA hydratase [Jiella sp. LLJ827]